MVAVHTGSSTTTLAATLQALEAWIMSCLIQIPIVARAMRAISLLKAFERAEAIDLRNGEGMEITISRSNDPEWSNKHGWSCCRISTENNMGETRSDTDAWDEGSAEGNMHAALDRIVKQR